MSARRGTERSATRRALAAVALALAVVACEAAPPIPSGSSSLADTRPTASPSLATPVVRSSPTVAPPSVVPFPQPASPPPDAAVAWSVNQPGAELDARLAAAAAAFRRSTGTPGLSIAIRWPDGTVRTTVAGYADVARRSPVTSTSAFAVGSVTKTFTSALVLALASEGRVDLDAPAARYLPKQKLDRRITVRMLLDHPSGLFDAFLAPGIDAALLAEPTARWSIERALGHARKPYFPPGRGWHYSNTNYLLLGLIAEAVTKRPLAAELRRRFVDPAALADTWLQGAEKPRAPIVHGYALSGPASKRRARDLADGTGVAPFTSVITALGPAGAIASTASDLATWAADLYGGDVLPSAMLAAMTDDQQRTSGYIPGVLYGLGVQLYRFGPWLTLGHSGRVEGFRAQMRYVPAAGLSVAVLANESVADLTPLVRSILGAVLRPASGPRLTPLGRRT
jgi:D-alanyl-D-alanine carboxypeptidase